MFESLFNKAEGLKAFLLRKCFEYCEIFKNSLLVEHFLFIILLCDGRILWTYLGTKIDVFYISCTIAVFLYNSSVRIETP